MVVSTFGGAFDKLSRETQRQFSANLRTRRHRYEMAMRHGYSPTKVILLADTPGPGRPNTPGYHHTPFYSTKNSSFWLNKLLIDHKVNEEDLIWFNTTLADGTPLDAIHLTDLLARPDPKMVICLGGEAEKWITKVAGWKLNDGYVKVHHPQAWKRFHSADPYPLIGLLQQALDL